MDAFGDQQVLLRTGSFTGHRPLEQLGSGYLEHHIGRQPFCSNKEGWGPISKFRYDFTPCFVDVWVAVVAVFGLLLGPIAVWYLLKKKPLEQVTSKTAQFWIKQVST